MNHRRNLESVEDVKIRNNVYPEISVADTCLRVAWHPGLRWLDSILGDSTEHERLIQGEVGKVQAGKQQEGKYERKGQAMTVSRSKKNVPAYWMSVGVSHSSKETLQREWSEGETLWC